MPATNTAMIAAPVQGEPEVRARACTDRVTPQGISTEANPRAAGASADWERARRRTNRLHDAGAGQIIYTDTKATGTNTVKVNGKVRARRALKAENVTERYVCTVTGMSLSTDEYTAELVRRTP